VLHCVIDSTSDTRALKPSNTLSTSAVARNLSGGSSGAGSGVDGAAGSSSGSGGIGAAGREDLPQEQGLDPARAVGKLTALHLAANGKDAARTRAFLSGNEGVKNGVGVVNTRDSNGLTALHYACAANAIEVAQVLIEFKADVNLADKRGCVPLHIAASCEEEHEAEDTTSSPEAGGLRAGGADTARASSSAELPEDRESGSEDPEGEDALDEALKRAEVREGALVRLLIEERARLNERDDSGWTALHWAASVDKVAAAAALLRAGADMDAPTKRGFTPLHVAARYESTTVAGFLVRSNADVLRRNSDGSRPIDLSGESAGRTVSKQLREATKRAVAIEHANKRNEQTDIKTSEVSALARGLIKLMQVRALVRLRALTRVDAALCGMLSQALRSSGDAHCV
jgi:ankyrin repeat protein